MLKNLLPMSGHTRGNRSPVTCALKCGNACAHAVPNTSDNERFQDIAGRAISRRAALGLGGGLAAAVVIGHEVATAEEALAGGRGRGPRGGHGGRLSFQAIDPVPRTVDTMTVPEGYDWDTVIRWGDPLFRDSQEFDVQRQTGASQAGQFGYNCDYLDVVPDRRDECRGYLVSNHEYTNENIMFSPQYLASNAKDAVDVGIQAHGLSVVEIKRRRAGEKWEYVRGGRRNRRITGTTEFAVTGPAAGHDLLRTAEDPTGTRVAGTLNNCAGGTTPWGTVLSGEENFNQYFKGRGTPEEARYGIAAGATTRGWETFYDRFDATKPGFENEANRFGWIVEVDPEDPTSTPVKHTALGRFKHEAGTAVIAPSGHAVVYSGDDERHDYLYKFVSSKRVVPGNKRHNMTLLQHGTLYVARFTGDSPAAEIDGTGTVPRDGEFDGSGTWIPLVTGNRSHVRGMSAAEVCVFTRLAADRVGATKMDRPEDVETNPVTGKVYMALTNNTQRKAVDEANPVIGNRDGHVIEITERRGDHAGTRFHWSILLLAGDPAVSSSAYFSGYPRELVSPISCPDNLAFDSQGNLWISTDGQPGTIGYGDALHKVTLWGRERGRVQQFLSVPRDAETCGPVIHDRDGSVFVNVQHPGENGTWGSHTSSFPDFLDPAGPVQVKDRVSAPRPSVVQVFKAADERGGGRGPGKGKGPGHGKGPGKGKGPGRGKGPWG